MIPGLALLREANKRYPETRIVWPAIAIVAALAVIDAFRLGWRVAALGAIVILVLLILYFIVAGVSGYLSDEATGKALLKYPAIVLVWTFTLAISIFVGLCLSCFFFGKPKTLAELFIIGDALVITEQGRATQPPPTTHPVALPPAPAAPPTGGEPSARNVAAVNRCLDAIDKTKWSVSEVEAMARECLRVQ